MSESKLRELSMEFSVEIIELVKYLKSIKESIISNLGSLSQTKKPPGWVVSLFGIGIQAGGLEDVKCNMPVAPLIIPSPTFPPGRVMFSTAFHTLSTCFSTDKPYFSTEYSTINYTLFI